MVRFVSILSILAVLAAGCTGAATDTTTSTAVATTDASTTTTEASTTTSEAAPTTAADLSGLEGVSPEVRAQLEELITAAEQVRELAFLAPPNITVVSTAELESRVRELIEEDADDFPADEALYKLLGLLEEDDDLLGLLTDLYGEQVAGFYDGDTEEVVVPSREEGLSTLQRGTLLHELVHALTDQHFDFHDTFQEMFDAERLDEASAYQALIEGDATLAEVLWVQGLSQRELGEFVAESLESDTTSLQGAPQFIQDSLIFPYDTGLGFVQTLYRSGGWEAVNEAYAVLPGLPGSSEQVITPEDYRRDLPVPVDLPQIDLEGYQLERTSVWGEIGFRIMLDQILGESVATRAAEGWGGDAYHQWFDGENAALLLAYRGDTEAELEELEGALVEYEATALDEEDFGLVATSGGVLYFVAADELEVGEEISRSIGVAVPEA